eukprot:375785-Rhodomonas_salina.1
MARWTSGLVMSYGLLAVVLLCVCDVVRGHPILAKSAVTVNEPEHAQRPHRCAHSSLTPQYTIGKQEYADIDSRSVIPPISVAGLEETWGFHMSSDSQHPFAVDEDLGVTGWNPFVSAEALDLSHAFGKATTPWSCKR